MKGSILIVDFANRAEPEKYLNLEPFILESIEKVLKWNR